MQLSASLMLLAPLTAMAGPLSPPSVRRAVSQVAADSQWTLTSLSRSCDESDQSCTWHFGIDTEPSNAGNVPQDCTLTTHSVTNDSGTTTPASQAKAGGPVTCGPFQVTSGWSGQFGAGAGFTTLSIVNQGAGLIAWAGYNDVDVGTAGATVSPDRSYPVQKL